MMSWPVKTVSKEWVLHSLAHDRICIILKRAPEQILFKYMSISYWNLISVITDFLVKSVSFGGGVSDVPKNFENSVFIFTGHRPMIDKLSNKDYGLNPPVRSGAGQKLVQILQMPILLIQRGLQTWKYGTWKSGDIFSFKILNQVY